MLKSILFLAIENCNKKIIVGLLSYCLIKLVSVIIISVNFTFVNLTKKKPQKQINIIKKPLKKNIYHKLSVKYTLINQCFFQKKGLF